MVYLALLIVALIVVIFAQPGSGHMLVMYWQFVKGILLCLGAIALFAVPFAGALYLAGYLSSWLK